MKTDTEIGSGIEIQMDWNEFKELDIIIASSERDEHIISIFDKEGNLLRAWHLIPINYKW